MKFGQFDTQQLDVRFVFGEEDFRIKGRGDLDFRTCALQVTNNSTLKLHDVYVYGLDIYWDRSYEVGDLCTYGPIDLGPGNNRIFSKKSIPALNLDRMRKFELPTRLEFAVVGFDGQTEEGYGFWRNCENALCVPFHDIDPSPMFGDLHYAMPDHIKKREARLKTQNERIEAAALRKERHAKLEARFPFAAKLLARLRPTG